MSFPIEIISFSWAPARCAASLLSSECSRVAYLSPHFDCRKSCICRKQSLAMVVSWINKNVDLQLWILSKKAKHKWHTSEILDCNKRIELSVQENALAPFPWMPYKTSIFETNCVIFFFFWLFVLKNNKPGVKNHYLEEYCQPTSLQNITNIIQKRIVCIV